MRLSISLITLPALVLIFASGCGTLFTGTSDSITFNSNPSGAMVMLNGVEKGRTPLTIRVKRGVSNQDVTLQMDGYEARTFTLDKSFNMISILNLGNAFGWGVDFVSGAMYKYDTKFYNTEMRASRSSMNIDDLQRLEDGRYVVPSTNGRLDVIDVQNGLKIVFE